MKADILLETPKRASRGQMLEDPCGVGGFKGELTVPVTVHKLLAGAAMDDVKPGHSDRKSHHCPNLMIG